MITTFGSASRSNWMAEAVTRSDGQAWLARRFFARIVHARLSLNVGDALAPFDYPPQPLDLGADLFLIGTGYDNRGRKAKGAHRNEEIGFIEVPSPGSRAQGGGG